MTRTHNGYEIKSFADLRGAELQETDLRWASLWGADLRGADLRGAYLRGAYLQGASLWEADLRGADLRGAYLRGAYLQGASLWEADLRGADLREADLREADLREADLRGAYLRGASLWGADLRGAKLPHFQIPQTGPLHGFKKMSDGAVIEILIPNGVPRTACLTSRKCRCAGARVLTHFNGRLSGKNKTKAYIYYHGAFVTPDKYNPDVRQECTHGIHFFLTREEAEEHC